MATILALSPITTFVRDVVVTTVVLLNQRMRWIICGSGRSGVSTLQAAFQTSSDIIPDLPTTEEKINARVIRAKDGGAHLPAFGRQICRISQGSLASIWRR